MAVVVMSLAAERGLVDAVRSVLAQDPVPEVVVVNSGGGDPAGALARAGLEGVPVVHREERLFAGGVRNLGIAATRSRYVAFLAADCLALPGWVAGRLRAHEEGADAVASLLCNADPGNRSAAASALLLHHRRMPHAAEEERLALGLSFDRRMLERVGAFREDLRTGEDSDYKLRMLAAGARIVVSDEVVTAHRYPGQPLALVRDQFERGIRQARARAAVGLHKRRRRLALDTLRNARRAMRGAARAPDPAERRRLLHGWPLIPVAALAYAGGALAALVADAARR